MGQVVANDSDGSTSVRKRVESECRASWRLDVALKTWRGIRQLDFGDAVDHLIGFARVRVAVCFGLWLWGRAL